MTNRLLCAATLLWLLASLSGGSAMRAQVATAQARHVHADTSLFAHSSDCVACHNNLTAASGEDVSIGATWRSTMMANAARDPYWQASLRRETLDHPQQATAIQDECAACHVPTLPRLARATGVAVDVFANAPAAGADESTLRALAADGISCTVCHQIANAKLGTRESFNGGFVIAPPHTMGFVRSSRPPRRRRWPDADHALGDRFRAGASDPRAAV